MLMVWRFLWKGWWNFCDIWYSLTGTRLQRPIEVFFPNHCEWVFSQMIGKKGFRVKDSKIDREKLEEARYLIEQLTGYCFKNWCINIDEIEQKSKDFLKEIGDK